MPRPRRGKKTKAPRACEGSRALRFRSPRHALRPWTPPTPTQRPTVSTRRRSDEALRVHTVSVRLAMDELQVLDERRQRMRRADYVRAAVLDRLPVLIPQANQSMWVAHGRFGQNLNQLIRAVHLEQVSGCPPELLAELAELIKTYRRALIGLEK